MKRLGVVFVLLSFLCLLAGCGDSQAQATDVASVASDVLNDAKGQNATDGDLAVKASDDADTKTADSEAGGEASKEALKAAQLEVESRAYEEASKAAQLEAKSEASEEAADAESKAAEGFAEATRLEAERKAVEEAEAKSLEAERKAAEEAEAERLEAERKAAEEAAEAERLEAERKAAEEAASERLTSPFSISFLGDSITVGYYSSYSYADLVCDDMGAVGYNYGISGNTLASDEGNGMVDRYANMHASDVIVVFGGTNDFYDDVAPGSITSWNKEEFYGALKLLCSGLKAKYPDAYIVFMTPLHGQLNERSSSADNATGNTMTLYVRAIKNVCADYDIPVIDLYDDFEINGDTYEKYTSDGLHPNENGHKLIAARLEEYLKSLM